MDFYQSHRLFRSSLSLSLALVESAAAQSQRQRSPLLKHFQVSLFEYILIRLIFILYLKSILSLLFNLRLYRYFMILVSGINRLNCCSWLCLVQNIFYQWCSSEIILDLGQDLALFHIRIRIQHVRKNLTILVLKAKDRLNFVIKNTPIILICAINI